MRPMHYQLILAIAAAALSWWLIRLYVRAMIAARKLEAPNERSMHSVPVPVGAGLAIVATAVILWPVWQGGLLDRPQTVLLACFAGLGALSWLDDRHTLSPAVRLGAHAFAVTACLLALPESARVLPAAFPLLAERILTALAWLWFINLFNFMDGIDGLAGSEAVAVTAGYLAFLATAGLDGPLAELALITAAATIGYLLWNWPPAKVFMGDAGSVPLGFLLGWLMLDLALRGHWAAALILPLYFAADATLTLLARLRRGAKPWQAHREHFYQRAVLAGATPADVLWRVGAVNAGLIGLAMFSASQPVLGLAAAASLVAALLANLQGLAAKRPS